MLLIDTEGRRYPHRYLIVDLKNKEVILVEKGGGGEPRFRHKVIENDEFFNALPPFWQLYCRKAWERMAVNFS